MAGMMMARKRGLVAAVLFFYLTLSVAEDAALSESVSDLEGAKDATITYDRIDGFILKGAHPTVIPDKTRYNCELMCSQSSACKSYSYSASQKLCVASEDALTYDQDFVFYAKKKGVDAKKGSAEYHQPFEGLTYKPTGWTKISGRTIAECMAMCSAAGACKSFSYRVKDTSCLVSEHGIEYSAKFSYYEKNRITPLAAKGAKSELGEITHSSAPTATAAPAKNAVIAALEQKTKAKIEQAAALQAHVKTVEVEDQRQYNEARAAAQTKVKLAAQKDKVDLEEMKAAFTKKVKEREEKAQNNLKLDFAKKELQDKVAAHKAEVEETKEKGTKAAQEISTKGTKKADLVLSEGRLKTETEKDKLQVAAELKAVTEVQAREGYAVANADKAKAGESSKLTNLKLKTKLALDEKHKEMKTKNDAATADRHVLAVTTAKRLKFDKVKGNEGAYKLETKAVLKMALLKVHGAIAKEKGAETAELKAKAAFQGSVERQQKYEAEHQAAKAKATKLQTAKISAINLRQANIDLATVSAKNSVQEAKMVLFKTKVNEVKTEISTKEKQHKTYMATMDKISKRKRKFRERMVDALEKKKKQMLVESMGAEKAKVDADIVAAGGLYKKWRRINKSWDAEKDTMIKNRNDDLQSMREQLDKARADNRKALLQARLNGKELIAKAQKRKEETVARAEAVARLRTATAQERAEKSPTQRKNIAKSVADVQRFEMVCDVAAYVDSGPNMKGVKEYPLAKAKLVTAKTEFARAKVKADESKYEYSKVKAKHHSLSKELNKTYHLNMNETVKGYDNLKNKMTENLKTANAKLSRLKSPLAMKQRFMEIESMGYGGVLNFTDLATMPPTPTPTPSPGSSSSSSATLSAVASSPLDETLLTELTELAEGADQLAPTAAPTPVPTPVPTFNQTTVKKLQRELKKLSEDSKKAVNLRVMQINAQLELQGMDKRFAERKKKLHDNFNTSRTRLNTGLESAFDNMNATKTALLKVETRLQNAEGVMGNLKVDPANHAFGKLPEEASKQGFLRLQHKNTREQSLFLKFPIKGLHLNDTIQEAHLKLFKEGGAGGPVRVETSSCMWQRHSITYSNSIDFAYTRASRGTTARLPAAEEQWISIVLKGDVIQNARVAGEHVCLRVSGGPANGHAVISSELTKQAPKLEVFAKIGYHPPPSLAVAQKKAKQPSPEEEEMKVCSAKLRRELTRRKTSDLLKQNRIAAFKRASVLKKVGPRGIAAMDIMAVLDMQIGGAEQALAMAKAETGALKRKVKVVVSKELTALANKNATDEELAQAVGQLRRKAARDVGEKAADNAQKIQTSVNQGLAQDEEKLQKKHKKLTAAYYNRKAEIIARGRVLSDDQKAKLKLEVEDQVGKQAPVVCKKIKPAEAGR